MLHQPGCGRFIVSAAVVVLGMMLPAAGQDPPQQSTTGPKPPPPVLDKSLMQLLPSATSVVIPGVPGYQWRHGCGPTAVGMVVGYYDTHGYADLFAGDGSTQTSDVNQGMASQGSGVRGSGVQKHYEDYSLPNDSGSGSVIPDSSATYPTGCHVDDCIADFMHTSWSKEGNFYGWSWSNKIAPSFTSYVGLRNSGYGKTCAQYSWSTLTWAVFTAEIDAGRPMVFLVDSDGNGGTDHFVTIVGYSDSPTQQYGCLDTWYPASQIRWCQFRPMSSSYAWGVWGGWKFTLRPVKPADPLPADGAVGQSTPVILSWSSAAGASSYDVYLGTSAILGSGDLRASQATTSLQVDGLAGSATYYWRVDARGAGNGVTVGDVWHFTTFDGPPLPPIEPSPADGAIDQLLTTDLAWANGGGAVDYDVYFGTNPEPGPDELRGRQPETSYDLPLLEPYTTYYWRIDAVNDTGVAPGTVWRLRTRAYGADFNGDGDVDQEDFGHLQICLSGGVPQLQPECRDARLNDDDERVDAVDLAIFLACHSGAGTAADVACTGIE